MKTPLLTFAIAITSTAIGISIHLAGFDKPTDIQKQLSTTTNAIAVAGTTAIFGLLDENDLDDKNSDS